MSRTKKLIAEFIGTFTLVFAGVMAICNDAGLAGTALAHGLALVVMISALGHFSGGHFNPAVTAGMIIGEKISAEDGAWYMISQLFGAIVAALLVTCFLSPDQWGAANLGTPLVASSIDPFDAAILEGIMAFFLVIVVFGTGVDKRGAKAGGLFIGLTVAMNIFAFGRLTGAALNPARVFGPALMSGVWDHHIIYWVGPLLGGMLAGVVYTKIFESDKV